MQLKKNCKAFGRYSHEIPKKIKGDNVISNVNTPPEQYLAHPYIECRYERIYQEDLSRAHTYSFAILYAK